MPCPVLAAGDAKEARNYYRAPGLKEQSLMRIKRLKGNSNTIIKWPNNGEAQMKYPEFI